MSLLFGKRPEIFTTPELGDVCLQNNYRREEDTLSICDLTGVGILDLAIALYAKNIS